MNSRMKLLFSTLGIALALIAPAGDLLAQARRGGPLGSPGQKKPARAKNEKQQAAEVERFERMSPVERRRALNRLPPERRARLEERFGKLQQMPPAERLNLRKRFDAFQSLPQDRKQAVRQEIRQLRNLSPEERKKRLQSPEMKKRFNEDERHLLEEVSTPGISPTAF